MTGNEIYCSTQENEKRILYVNLEISCPTFLGHLQLHGISRRLRPLSICLAINGRGLPVAQSKLPEI